MARVYNAIQIVLFKIIPLHVNNLPLVWSSTPHTPPIRADSQPRLHEKSFDYKTYAVISRHYYQLSGISNYLIT